MVVWILIEEDYDTYSVIGVYSTEEAAASEKDRLDKMRKNLDYNIECREVDDGRTKKA